ncbi:MAG: MATE family efflux transporter [Rhodospirillales bacterium]|nr:MATE family efflux transporter [Rhodospirillales bacterium]
MLDRYRLRIIWFLALPIIGGQMSQNLLNLVDMAMAGVLGPYAVAAVGLGGFVNFTAGAVVIGLSSGVQAMAARRKGEGRESVMAVPLNGGLLLALAIGVPTSAAVLWTASDFFPLVNSDPEVYELGVPYIQMRIIAMTALGMNFAFRGYWNAINRSMVYLRTLLVMHAVNIFLNYVLIFGKLGFPEMGVAGAGLGSAIATFVGCGYYFAQGLTLAKPHGFFHGLPDRATMATMVRLSIPSCIQQLFFSLGFLTLFWIIGRVGTLEVAAANVLINIVLVAILPGNGLGLAAASLVGQSLGAGKPHDAHQWGWDVVKVATLLLACIGLPMVVAPDIILGAFLHDPATLNLARLPLQITGVGVLADAAGIVLLNALLGAGAARQVMVMSVLLQWLVFLPAAWLVGPVLGWGLVGVWSCFIGYRALQAVALVVMWEKRHWTDIKV